MQVPGARALKLISIVAAVVALAGCSSPAPTTSAAKPAGGGSLTKVRAYGGPSLLYMPAYVGVEQGFFTNHGLEVETAPLTAGNRVSALLSGQIEFALSAIDSAILPAGQGQQVPMIAMMQQLNSLSLHARADESLPHKDLGYPENVQDLKGKTIGVTQRGAGDDVFLQQIMNAAGLKEGGDYTVTAIGNVSNILASLKGKRIDAAVLFPPYAEQAVKDGTTVALISEGKGEGPGSRRLAHGIGVQTSQAYIDAHSDIVKNFITGLVEAERFNRDFAKNKEKLIDIAAKYTGVTDREVLGAALETESALANPVPSCDKVKVAAEGLVSVGTIQTVPPCDQVIAQKVAPTEP